MGILAKDSGLLFVENIIMKTYKITIICVALLFVFLAGCNSVKEPTFTISGKVRNPQKGKVVLSKLEDINRKKTKVIGAISVNANGEFNKEFSIEPHIYEVDFYGKKKVMLAIDKGQKVEIFADGSNLKDIKISGSPDTDKLNAYETFRKDSLDRLVKSVRADIKKLEAENKPENKETIEKLGVAEIKNYEKHRDELNDFIKENMSGSISMYPTTLRWDGGKNVPLYESLAKSISDKNPDSEVAKRILEKIVVIKNTDVGGTSSPIAMPDADGKEIAISDIKAKYTLIDFWASWCGPCRRESKKLNGLYSKYKDKGFDIYGVSLDTEKDLWMKAIDKDKRTWANVSTLQGFETPVTFEYAVTALPAKFLIDGNGKIVAKNLHGKDLEEKLNELLGK